jgi:hypothetical protein
MPDDDGLNFLGTQRSPQGRAIGPKLLGTLFVPHGYGVAWIDSNGAFWQMRLALNADGTTAFDEDGRPTTELIQITI